MLTEITFKVQGEKGFTDDDIHKIKEYTHTANGAFRVKFPKDADSNKVMSYALNDSLTELNGRIVIGRSDDYLRTNDVIVFWSGRLSELTRQFIDRKWSVELGGLQLKWDDEKGWRPFNSEEIENMY